MSTKYTDIQFLKVDVDDLKDIARQANIFAMPTFIIYKDGKKTSMSQRGADKNGLRKLLESITLMKNNQPLSVFPESEIDAADAKNELSKNSTPSSINRFTSEKLNKKEYEKNLKKNKCCLIC